MDEQRAPRQTQTQKESLNSMETRTDRLWRIQRDCLSRQIA